MLRHAVSLKVQGTVKVRKFKKVRNLNSTRILFCNPDPGLQPEAPQPVYARAAGLRGVRRRQRRDPVPGRGPGRRTARGRGGGRRGKISIFDVVAKFCKFLAGSLSDVFFSTHGYIPRFLFLSSMLLCCCVAV